eukprot:g40377.t1
MVEQAGGVKWPIPAPMRTVSIIEGRQQGEDPRIETDSPLENLSGTEDIHKSKTFLGYAVVSSSKGTKGYGQKGKKVDMRNVVRSAMILMTGRAACSYFLWTNDRVCKKWLQLQRLRLWVGVWAVAAGFTRLR